LAQASFLLLLAIGAAAAFLRADPVLLGASLKADASAAPPAPAAPKDLDPADRGVLERLEKAMAAEELWRREDLTIAALAVHVGAPEYRLRRLINDRLGFRNFAAFINARRIEAAKRDLRDPAKARVSVSTIAFELGFGSLGPFNRAFKDATGVTPSGWRAGEG
jgi:AraC-like DNA-binding protein